MGLKKVLRMLWHLWFAIAATIPVILFLPLIYLSIIFGWQMLFTWLKRTWGRWIICCMGFRIDVDNQAVIDKKKQYMIIGNHTSKLDIMVLLQTIKLPFVFVGKKELAKIPIFGYLFKKSNVTVDRKSMKSRKDVYRQVADYIEKGNSVAIYPEGGIPSDTNLILDQFKNGAFRMAIEHQLPIIPMVYFDNKKKFPYSFDYGYPGKLRVKILPVIPTNQLSLDDLEELRDYCYRLIYNELMNELLETDFKK